MGPEIRPLLRRGLTKEHALIEYKVWQWKKDLEQSRASHHVTKTEIQSFALNTYKEAGINNFKASDGWYRRWRLRWQDSALPKITKSAIGAKKNRMHCTSEATYSSKKNLNVRKDKVNDLSTRQTNTDKSKRSVQVVKNKLKVDEQTPTPSKNILPLRNADKFFVMEIDSKSSASKNIVVDEAIKYTELLKSIKDDSTFSELLGLVRDKNESPTSALTTPSIEKQTLNKDKVYNNEDNDKPTNINTKIKNLTNFASEHFNNTSSSGQSGNTSPKESLKTIIETQSSKLNNYEFSRVQNNLIKSSSSDIEIESSVVENYCSSQKNFFCNEDGRTFTPNGINEDKIVINNPSKNLFDQNYANYEDHDVYCDLCEDFHPHNKAIYSQSCKQKQKSEDFLLNCVLGKKSTKVETDVHYSENKSITKQCRSSAEVSKSKTNTTKSPNLFLSKGKRYQSQFKEKVTYYALTHSVKKASINFQINRGTVSDWLNERKRCFDSGPSKSIIVEEKKQLDDSKFLSWLENSKFHLTNDLIKQKTAEWLQPGRSNQKKTHWLHMYAHRLHESEHSLDKKRYIVYPDAFKRVAVFYAETNSIMAAARVFNVARRRVFEWRELSGKEKNTKFSEKAHSLKETVDKQLFEWYCSQVSSPSSKQVRDKGLELYRSAGCHSIQCGVHWYNQWRVRHNLTSSQSLTDSLLLSWSLTQLDKNQSVTHTELASQAQLLTNNKVSRKWTFGFCKRHYKLLLSLPKPNTPLPPAMELQVSDYKKFLQDVVASNGFSSSNIIAMDEIPIRFLPQDYSKKPLLIRRPGFESSHASLVVSCSSDGTLLPTVVIFKGNLPSGDISDAVIPTVSATGIITDDIMNHWVEQVCLKQMGSTGGVLVTDCFGVHTTEDIQSRLRAHHVHHAVTPGGCAFKLLPLIKVCHSFKSMLEEMCRVSFTNQTSTLRPPTHNELYQWTLLVHFHLAKLEKENIKAGFKELLSRSAQEQVNY